MKTLLGSMPPGDASAWSRQVCQRVIAWAEFAKAAVVMLYAPVPGEVDVRAIGDEAIRRGKRVCLPRADWQEKRIVPAEVKSLDRDLVTARNGISEPGLDAPALAAQEIGLVLVPGLAFDLCGARLGRGAGFYDRFLAEPGLSATTCAPAFDLQIVDSIPSGPLDVPVGYLATPSRLVAAASRPRHNG